MSKLIKVSRLFLEDRISIIVCVTKLKNRRKNTWIEEKVLMIIKNATYLVLFLFYRFYVVMKRGLERAN